MPSLHKRTDYLSNASGQITCQRQLAGFADLRKEIAVSPVSLRRYSGTAIAYDETSEE